MVKRPKCKLCGHEHYTHEPHVWDGAVAKRADNPLADKPVTKGRNAEQAVTKNVTCQQCMELRVALKTERAECEALRAEVKTLKLALAQSHGGKPKALTAAERMRKMRAAKPKRSGEAVA
jgi:hypothetical protein